MSSTALTILELTEDCADIWTGESPAEPPWIYGGQAVAQSLVAATRTVEGDRHVNSMHCAFLREGDPNQPVRYQVDRLRDGRAFSSRSVTARQQDRVIFTMTCTFHRTEITGVEHQLPPPDVDPPDGTPSSVPSEQDRGWPSWLLGRDDIDLRFARGPLMDAERGEQLIWARVVVPPPEDVRLHACLWAYVSDLTLLLSVRHHHEPNHLSRKWSTKTLDHSLWFHRPFRADDWLLIHQHSPVAHAGRGLTRAVVYDRAGILVCSMAQEGVVREIR